MNAEQNSPRVLVIKLSSLGDLFHVLPAVHALRVRGGMQVDWVTQPEYAPLVACFNGVRRIISFPRRAFARHAFSFARDLRKESYDWILDFQGLLKSALTARCARGGRRLGPAWSREGARYLYDESVGAHEGEPRHAIDRAFDFTRRLGWAWEEEPVFPMAFPPTRLCGGRPRVGLLPCSRWPSKNWPAEHWAVLGKRLKKQAGAELFLFGAREDSAVCDAIESALDGDCENHCGRTHLPGLGSMLQAMDLVVTADSGPMHMAAATGTPVVAVFGPTDPARVGPRGAPCRIVAAERTSCWPCRKRRCPRCREALVSLPPERVLEAALDLLSAPRYPVAPHVS